MRECKVEDFFVEMVREKGKDKIRNLFNEKFERNKKNIFIYFIFIFLYLTFSICQIKYVNYT